MASVSTPSIMNSGKAVCRSATPRGTMAAFA